MKPLIGLNDIKFELNHLKDIPHILFAGPRGAGKTTLARYIADLRGKKLIFATGNTLKMNELLNIFVNIQEGDVLLIDEIHRLTPKVEEMLYQPLEMFQLPIRQMGGDAQLFPLPKFSLIGTTTKPSMLSKPLLSRFQITYQIPHYNLRELSRIILNNYKELTTKDAILIAENTVTPREAINLAFRVTQLGTTDIKKNLEFIGYKYGLSRAERFYLKILYNVGHVSLASMCSALQLDPEEVSFIEDKLLQKRYLQISSKGRTLTFQGLQKVKMMK